MSVDRSLRVLVVGLAWPPETFLARLVRGLAAAGVTMSLATTRRPDSSWLDDPHIEWVPVAGWEGPSAARLWRSGGQLGAAALRNPTEIARFYQAETGEGGPGQRLVKLQRWLPYSGRQWDVIYFPWNSAAIGHQPLFDLAPTVVSCRGAQINIAPHNPQRQNIHDGLRTTLRRASAVHCVSEAIREEATHYGLNPDHATVIRPAVDPEFFRPASRKTNKNRDTLHLVSTGSLIWRKGYEYALSAVRLLAGRGVPVQFDIIGDGPERSRVLYTIHDLGLSDHVRLHGQLTPDQVRNHLQSADIFLLSSLSEGISNAVLEGMACGLPIVTTDVGGMDEAVTNGVEGLLAPPRAPEALATALEKLGRDRQGRLAMGLAGRQRVMADFALPGQIEAFVKLFEDVAR